MARTRTHAEIRAWLATSPPLEELRAAYPAEWQAVQRELAAASERGKDGVAAYGASLRLPGPAVGPLLVRRAMALLLLRELSVSAATGVRSGKVRFGLVQGSILQRLLFDGPGLVRKPVRLGLFRLLWPLLPQRRLLMPLVQPKGIYCFYSGALVRELARLAGGRPVLEIAAGDGTLARFLCAAGADVTATDDGSWASATDDPADVLRQDARTALRERAPEVVVCSWPPAGNGFEREVFRTPSVQLYVAINAAAAYGSGDRAAYAEQDGFTCEESAELARLVLPPELGCVVHVFRRTAGADAGSGTGARAA